MDKQLLEKAILVHVYVPDGGSGYKLRWDFACEAYILHIITHILCRSGEEAVKKCYAKKVTNVLPSHSFEITTKGFDCALLYMEKAGFEQWIYDLALKQEACESNENPSLSS
jgi:hypothetical protein